MGIANFFNLKKKDEEAESVQNFNKVMSNMQKNNEEDLVVKQNGTLYNVKTANIDTNREQSYRAK